MLKKHLPLLSILTLSLILRLFWLGNYPQGLNPDEASQGYSAYSLLKTGRDEWGRSWPPTAFRSFLDFKAPLYTYLAIPSVALFGLNEFSVRLPSAIIGVLTIFGIYLLTQELSRKVEFNNKKLNLGLIASFLLAISPWSISFSRSAMEANLAPFLLIYGLYFFIKSLSLSKYFIFSSIFFGLSLYAYHSAKIFLPIFIFFILLKYRPKLKRSVAVSSITIFAVLATVIYAESFFGSTGRRGGELLITNLNSERLKVIQDVQYFASLPPSLSRLFFNKITFFWHQFLDNYLSYFSPVFWFSSGSGATSYSNLPNYGLLYWWLLPLIITGLYISITKNHPYKYLLVMWLLLGPLPAAITKDGYHAHRSVLLMGFWEIIAAYGFLFLSNKLNFHRLGAMLLTISGLVSVSFYVFNLFVTYPIRYPNGMSGLFNPAIKEVVSLSTNYQSVHLPERLELQSLVAFYSHINPQVFQDYSKIWWEDIQKQPNILYLDQLPIIRLDKYLFKSFNWPDDIKTNTLYMNFSQSNLPENRRTIKTIYQKDQSPYLEIFDFNVQE